MEEINKVKTAVAEKNIQRLSIVDSIDSLYLFTYDYNEDLISHTKHRKTGVDISTFLRELNKTFGDISYKLYYSSADYEILPREMFLYGNEDIYLQNITPIHKKGVINFTDKCAEQKLVILYPVDAMYDINMREAIRGLHTFHISTPILKSSKFEDNVLYCYVLSSQVFYLLKEGSNWIANYSCVVSNDLSANVVKHHALYKDRIQGFKLIGDIDESKVLEIKGKHDFIEWDNDSLSSTENYITL